MVVVELKLSPLKRCEDGVALGHRFLAVDEKLTGACSRGRDTPNLTLSDNVMFNSGAFVQRCSDDHQTKN